MSSLNAAQALAKAVRSERTALVATLVRRYGFDLAEEAVDCAIEAALVQWQEKGIPDSPKAWLLSVARRRAIDRVRHGANTASVRSSLAVVNEGTLSDEPDLDGASFHDDRLRLVFTCCHPAIAPEAQVALALRWLSGLSTEDVARAFCVPVETMAQRLGRAKKKIEAARIPYEVPERRELPERVSVVLEVVYAIFNEGYVATEGESLQRIDLAEEALHLTELLNELLPDRGDVKALLALLLLVFARRHARVSEAGDLIRLEEQDRTRWDDATITRGKAMLKEALELGPPTPYAIEAAIQALHDEAPSYAETDFRQITELYGVLRRHSDAPVVAINHAVARAMADGAEEGLRDLLALEGTMRGHPALPAAKADLYRRLGRYDEACAAYDEAMRATKNEAERRFLATAKAEARASATRSK